MEGAPHIPRNIEPGEMRRPEYGPIFLDIASRSLQAAGTDKREFLSPQEYQVLWLLVRAQGKLVTTEEIQNFLMEDLPDRKGEKGHDRWIENTSITTLISRVRDALDTVVQGAVTIDSRKGLGYELVLSKP